VPQDKVSVDLKTAASKGASKASAITTTTGVMCR
jgi:hypothetical protein